jgi:hypothetical protein
MMLSHLDVAPSKDLDRHSSDNTVSMSMVKPDGTSDFPGYGIKDFGDVPLGNGLAEMTATIKVIGYKKVGTKKQTRWETSTRMIEEVVPVYDSGKTLAEGTVTVIPEKASTLTATDGKISFPMDQGYSGDQTKITDYSGSKKYPAIYLTQTRDANYPWDFDFIAFNVKISDLNASLRANPVAAIKADLGVFATASWGEMSVFKNTIFTSNIDKSWTIGTWTPVMIGGLTGEKAIITGNGAGARKDDVSWVYLIQHSDVVTIAYVRFGGNTDLDGYTYEKYFEGLTPEQRVFYEATFDKMATLLKLAN